MAKGKMTKKIEQMTRKREFKVFKFEYLLVYMIRTTRYKTTTSNCDQMPVVVRNYRGPQRKFAKKSFC